MKEDSIRKLFKPIFRDFDLVFTAKIPVDKHVIKKNSRPIFINRATGKRFIGKDKELADAENYLTLKLKSEANKLGLRSIINEKIIVTFLFYFKKSDFLYKNGTEKRIDLSNLYQLPEDCLQAANIIKDDSLIVNHGFSTKLVTEGDQNILEVLIFRPKYRGPEEDPNEKPVEVAMSKRAKFT